jgi:hypothetical protein
MSYNAVWRLVLLSWGVALFSLGLSFVYSSVAFVHDDFVDRHCNLTHVINCSTPIDARNVSTWNSEIRSGSSLNAFAEVAVHILRTNVTRLPDRLVYSIL